ncbi:helicase-related protein [Polyangium sp. y55x31]|uniref:helicase-related protein n=1 Tax=Polyangium sp. y55x31 TaxID=3042688 RepID=UPI0024831CE8|nr:helicase-related protein [Polyangium sp. y55x31]MDI1480385.1 helicase-related protein [Polyangium sp. y55x31]
MNTPLFRDRILDRLVKDLVGPLSPNEILSDRPTQRYSTGILYPRDARIEPQEDEDGGIAVNIAEDAASEPEEAGVSLHAALKPATAGLSFAVESSGRESPPTIRVQVECAVYKRFAVDDAGNQIEGAPPDRAHERWQHVPRSAEVEIELRAGSTRRDLAYYGIEGLELYALMTPHAGVETVTLAVASKRSRGDSSAFDEEQHFFQVELSVTMVANGRFAPRPSRRAQTDEDSRTAALIYRDVKEYVVGHTCSARAVLDGGGVAKLKTEWVPAVIVPRVSDHGDLVFGALHQPSDGQRPLEARWLAAASSADLIGSLEQVVSAYRQWIAREAARVPQLPTELHAQARKHIDRCQRGAERMADGIAAIRTDKNVRTAFQLAQSAMATQFGWSHGGAALKWRPFQLAFQLLVLPSLAQRTHDDRDTMDLLWFPTGGGKTEAYLALTAFIITLRRLRATKKDDGAGVAALMRYTLRLLTVQQFQRAAAMIFACELLRRRGAARADGLPDLGTVPIGIGLWVGAAATPLTLQEALNRSPGDPSTPEQLTTCPCCGSTLSWKLTPKESIVECASEPTTCELAQSGPRLPVWTIDEEIYRHAPSLLIGTVDKFAQIVRKLDTGVIFGRGTAHAPPDLIIQDELHLISGPLGSMAGLYEVAIDELCRSDSVRPKVIGSTATIRRAEEQIRSLFDRGTYQFPAPGLDAGNSGFAVTDPNSPGRLYVGLTTAGRSATYMLQALVASMLQAATAPGASLQDKDHYWTLVAYFNSLRELGRALVLMQDDVPVSIRQFAARRGEQQRRIEAPAELTSRVRSYEIRDMLNRLNKPATDPEAVDLLVASNMISVGMDIPRLGLMVVNAQPKTLSEYIQATSRVGRGDVPGIVITMYNSMRARDRSHFETFETWHRCLYRDVEATSVTPFASRAQDKALHAVLVALVRHLVPGMDRRPILNDIKRADAERIASTIEARVARVDPAERTIVSQKLQRLIDQWASRPDLQTYWDDYNRRTSLLMSAEQFAAKADVDSDLDAEGARRALWPTPNSMREVEPGAPFVLRHVLKTEGN